MQGNKRHEHRIKENRINENGRNETAEMKTAEMTTAEMKTTYIIGNLYLAHASRRKINTVPSPPSEHLSPEKR
jgi:5-hydroxyisourate hydrolase-like protein (transthyretin family)